MENDFDILLSISKIYIPKNLKLKIYLRATIVTYKKPFFPKSPADHLSFSFISIPIINFHISPFIIIFFSTMPKICFRIGQAFSNFVYFFRFQIHILLSCGNRVSVSVEPYYYCFVEYYGRIRCATEDFTSFV